LSEAVLAGAWKNVTFFGRGLSTEFYRPCWLVQNSEFHSNLAKQHAAAEEDVIDLISNHLIV
jgi:hypothetical protein